MLIGFNAFGDMQLNNVLPTKQTFDKSYFYGDAVFDDIHLRDFEMTDTNIFNITTEGTFDLNTLLLGQFENNLEAGNVITGLGLPLTKYIVRRRETGSSLNITIDELVYSPNLNTYIDKFPQNNVNYTYTLTPIYDDGVDRFEGQGTEGSDFVAFYGWILSDATESTSYNFDLEISSTNLQTITDYKLYENYTKYPAFRFGEMEYIKGGLTTIPYTYTEATDTYDIDLTTLNTIKAFINDKKEKILRNTNGEAFRVITNNFSYKYFDETPDQIYTISFEFTEVGAYP